MSSSDALDSFQYDVAYQGQPGAFSEDAAFDFVPPGSRLLSSRTLEDAFSHVADSTARYAVVPVENTLAGPIDETYDLLAAGDLAIADETVQPISHCLIAAEGTVPDSVRRVLSHPIALAQCGGFLRAHPEWEPVPAFDTAGAVEMVLRQRLTDCAAIGSARSAEVYGGQILLEDVQDHPENYTRFLLLCLADQLDAVRHEGHLLKTSICFQVPHAARRSSGVLRPFIENGIPLTNVLSRPVRGGEPESVYHVDFVGWPKRSDVARALAELERGARSIRILGTYPLRVATIREIVRNGA